MHGRIIAAALLLCAATGTVTELAAQNTATQRLVSSYSGKEPLRSGVFGVLAVRGADTLAQYNRMQKMVPASNVKLITTGLALTRLGEDRRFSTTLSYSGSIAVDGTLDGDLYIVGGGDPTIGAGTPCADSLGRTFAVWKALIDSAGIKAVNGRVVGDPRFFSRPYHGMSWQVDDLGWNYGAGPSGLSVFQNAQTFTVEPAGVGTPPVITPLYPDTPWMVYTNSAVTGEARSANTLFYQDTDFGPYGEFFGSFPADRKSYILPCSNAFGAYTCAYLFHNYLTGNGVAVSGGYADISPSGNIRGDLRSGAEGPAAASPDSLVKIGSAVSPVLRSIVKDTNYISDNFYAETLFNMLPLALYGKADRQLADRAEREMLSSMGLRTGNACVLVDGSGLSRKNYVSPEYFVRFLRKMYSGRVRGAYIESLPSPGTKSTLRNRMGKASLEVKNRVKMKSGSMNGVVCFSGYILPAKGSQTQEPVVFSILTNDIGGASSASSVYAIIDEIILSLAQEP